MRKEESATTPQGSGGLRSPHHLVWQIGMLLGVCAYLCSLHADNNGLWFQGDAPRHAANGFFWIDYLRDFQLDAKDYALRYYARYPVIDPASRPPVFYLLEGAAYTVLGPSPYVAKGLVLCFAMLSAIYLLAWLRRWVGKEAGWAAGLILLLPAIVTWSHAIMLNVPALALSLGALYHARRWLDGPAVVSRHLWAAAALTVLATLTYYTAGMVVFVMLLWIPFRGRWERLATGRTVVAAVLCTVVLLPFLWLVSHWAPTQLSWVVPDPAAVVRLSNWTYYPQRMLQLCSPHLLILAAGGLMAGVWLKRWRHESLMLITWLLAVYVVLSLLHAKAARYGLLLSAPLIGFCAIAVITVCHGLGSWARDPQAASTRLATIVFVALLLLQSSLAATYHVPSIDGYQEVAAFLEQVAPEEPVFYDGRYDGVFTFYVRAGDDRFRRRVVLGHKLLYTYALVAGWRQKEFVSSPEEVIEVLRRRGGCRWLAIETGGVHPCAAVEYLHEAVKTPAFELVRSFPIEAARIDRVAVYRLRGPVANVATVELPFPILGPDVTYRVRPIPARHSQQAKAQ